MPILKYDVIINTSGVDSDLKGLEKKFSKTDQKIAATGKGLAKTAAKQKAKAEEDELKKVGKNKEKLEEKIWQAKARIAKKYARLQVASEIKNTRELAKAKERIERESAARRQKLMRGIGRAGMMVLGAGITSVSALAGAGIRDELASGLPERQLANKVKAGGDSRNIKDINAEIGYTTKELARTYGVSRMDAGALLSGYQERGGKIMSAEEAKTYMGIAMSSGMDFKEAGNMAGLIGQQLAKEGLDGSELAEATLKMTQAAVKIGDVGNIDAAEMVGEMGKIMQAVRSQGGGTDELGRLLAGAQRSGLDAAQAATSMVSFQSRLISQQKDLKNKYKVNVMDNSGKLKNIEDIKIDVLKATGGDLGKLQKIFGETGFTYISSEAGQFLDFKKEAKESGKTNKQAAEYAAQKMREVFSSEVISVDKTELEANIANILNDPALQLKASFENLKQTLAESLMPIMPELVSTFKDLLPTIIGLSKAISGIVGMFNKISGNTATRQTDEALVESTKKVSDDQNFENQFRTGKITPRSIQLEKETIKNRIKQQEMRYEQVGTATNIFGQKTESVVGTTIKQNTEDDIARLKFLEELSTKGIEAAMQYGNSTKQLESLTGSLKTFQINLEKTNDGMRKSYQK